MVEDAAAEIVSSPERDPAAERPRAQEAPKPLALIDACAAGKLLEVRQLLKDKADPNMRDAGAADVGRQSPLLAASAKGHVGVAAALLLAGADPCAKSAHGESQVADMTTEAGIKSLLLTFSTELDIELKACEDPSLPSAREEALARVRDRAIPLVEKALHERYTVDGDLMFDDGERLQRVAQKAAERRGKDEEEIRRMKVAQKAAARRGIDDEEERQLRIAQKAAQRRATSTVLVPLDPEEARLQKIAQKAAARRAGASTALVVVPPTTLVDDGSSESSSDRRGRRDRRKHRDRDRARDRDRRKKADKDQEMETEATGETILCPRCGQCGDARRCGWCNTGTACGSCSTCHTCGRASGFCTRTEEAVIPGMCGTLGMPEKTGLSTLEEAWEYEDSEEEERARRKRKKEKKRQKKRLKEQERSRSRGRRRRGSSGSGGCSDSAGSRE